MQHIIEHRRPQYIESMGRLNTSVTMRAAVPTMIDASTHLGLKRPGKKMANDKGTNVEAALSPMERNPRSLM